jgi:hypothetical protein
MISSGVMAQQVSNSLSAEASIGNLRYLLIDLDPNDGIAPWLTLTPEQRSIEGFLASQNAQALTKRVEEGSMALERDGSRIWGTLGPDAISLGATASGGLASASGQASYAFSFSPNTRVIFTADAALATSPYHLEGGFHRASSSLDGWFVGFDGPVTFSSGLTSGFGDGARSGLLEATMRSGGAETTGHLSFNLWAWTEISPVPEPGRISMLLAGCCALGLAAFRRRRTTARA